MAKVSTSGEEARELGYLRRADLVAMNLDRLVADAKETALGLVRGEWRQTAPPATEPSIRVLGEEFSAAAKLAVHMMRRGDIYRNTMRGCEKARAYPGGWRAHSRNWSANNTCSIWTRGVRLAVRRTQNSGADSAYTKNRETPAELSSTGFSLWGLVLAGTKPPRLEACTTMTCMVED